MADWIKAQNDLDDDPRVRKVARLIKVNLPRDQKISLALGAIMRVWFHFDLQSQDGFIPGIDQGDIDVAGGNLDGLGDAMIAAGWLEVAEDGARLPRFEKHNSASAKRRAVEAQRSASRRFGGRGAVGVRSECGRGAVAEAVESPTSEREDSLSRAREGSGPPDDIALAYATSRPTSFTLDDIRRARIRSHGVTEAEVEQCWQKFIATSDAKGHTYQNWDRALDAYALTWGSNAKRADAKAPPGKRPDANPHADLDVRYDCKTCGQEHRVKYGQPRVCLRGAA